MDDLTPPPHPTAASTSQTKRDGDEDDFEASAGRVLGSVDSVAAKRRPAGHNLVSPEIHQKSTPTKKKKGNLEITAEDEEESDKEKSAEGDILHGTMAAAGDNNTTVCDDQKMGEPESSTKPAAIEVLAATSSEVPTEMVDSGILTARLLQQEIKLDLLQGEKDALTARVHDLEQELVRRDEQLVQRDELFVRQDEKLVQKEAALRQAGEVIGAAYCSGFDKWVKMPEMLRNEPGAMTEYVAQQSSLYGHERDSYPEDVLQKALPQLLERHRAVALKALDGGFLSWDEVKPTPEEYNRSEAFFIRAIRHGFVKDLSEVPFSFQESIPVHMEALKHGTVTDISQISHLLTTSVSLSVQALKQGLLTLSSQAPALSGELVLDALRMGLLHWVNVADDHKNDLEFCRALLCPQPEKFDEHPVLGYHTTHAEKWSELAMKVFELHRTTLFPDYQVWKTIIDFSSSQPADLYGYPATELFRGGNRQPTETNIIRYACTKCPTLLRLIDQVLHDDLVRELVIADRSKLFLLEAAFLHEFPDFFIEQLALMHPQDLNRVDDDDPRYLLYKLPETVWFDPRILNNPWFDVGLPLCRRFHIFESDAEPEVLLWFLQHGAKQIWRVRSFEGISDELGSDIDFISRAMEFEPAVLQYASPTLKANEDLRLWALSDPFFVEKSLLPDLGVRRYSAEGYTLPKDFVEDMNALAADLRMQQAFMKVFLMAVESESHQSSVGLLRNPDAYLRSIRDYAGIPCGNTLQHSRLALRNVKTALESRGVSIPATWST